jgi:hypothetical protein
MSFANEASKLLTNKYFLYFIVFLAVSNVLGYLVTNKINAVIFFALICLLMANFSKNMIVVLIVAIIATNLLMVNGKMREGMENAEGTTELTDEQKAEIKTEVTEDAEAIKAKRASTAAAPVPTTTTDATTDAATTDSTTTVDATTDATTVDATSTPAPVARPNAAALKAKVQGTTTATTTTTTPATTTTDGVAEGFAPAGVGYSGNKRGALGGPAKPSRIDYATTLEDAYDNLDKILGSGGMKSLSADTEKLMNQQKNLFASMNSMMPLVGKAQDMLKGFDMDKINKLADMSASFGGAKPKA